MDFPFRIAPILRPLLFPLRVSGERAMARVGGGRVRVEFGVLFRGDFPLEQIASVGHSMWPWWGGAGLQLGPRGRVALIGSLMGVVSMNFTRAQRVRAPMPWNCHELVMSLEDPVGFIATVQAAIHMAAA